MHMLICPLCHNTLNNQLKSVSCTNHHCFDKAKQGYLNLLPVQYRNSLTPGDNLEMVMARRNFLKAGHYAPLAKRFTELVKLYTPYNWLDVGCGEGYYTYQLMQALPQSFGYALDISKEAIKQACKLTKQINWLVASMAHIPLANQSCDLITAIFSPFNWQEGLRLLRSNGSILRLGPTKNHLIELREKLYDQVHPYEDDKHLLQVPHELKLDFTDTLSFTLTLNDSQDRKNLIAMTPHGWRANKNKRELVIANPLTVTIAVRFDYFKLK